MPLKHWLCRRLTPPAPPAGAASVSLESGFFLEMRRCIVPTQRSVCQRVAAEASAAGSCCGWTSAPDAAWPGGRNTHTHTHTHIHTHRHTWQEGQVFPGSAGNCLIRFCQHWPPHCEAAGLLRFSTLCRLHAFFLPSSNPRRFTARDLGITQPAGFPLCFVFFFPKAQLLLVIDNRGEIEE